MFPRCSPPADRPRTLRSRWRRSFRSCYFGPFLTGGGGRVLLMKSFLSIVAVTFLAGALAGCGGGHGGPPPHKDAGPDGPDMMKIVPHHDGGVVDGGDGSTGPVCGANGPAL